MKVRRHVKRLLAGHRKDTGEPIYPEFISFEGGGRPRWWKEEIAAREWGEILGVHEKEPDRRAMSILITERGLALLDEEDAKWVRYEDIDRWDQLSKEPVSESLRIWTKAGSAVDLPFNGGGAFTFARFLSRTSWEHQHDVG